MRKAVTIAVALLMAASLVAMGGVALANDDGTNEVPNDVEPGERMSGILGVQDAEIQGEIAERGFGIAVANASTEDAQADIVAEQLTDVEDRLEELDERLAALKEDRAAGEISEGEYRAEVAKLEAERATAERLANQSAKVAQELPEGLLAERGISVENISELRERADELTGPEVAEIAQGIAGPHVGEQVAGEADDRIPDDAGPPGDFGPAVNDTAADSDDESEVPDDPGTAADGMPANNTAQ